MAPVTDRLAHELTAAIAAVRTASDMCRGAQGRLLAGRTPTKGDASPVTLADFADRLGDVLPVTAVQAVLG